MTVAAGRVGRQYTSESPVDALAAELLRRYGNADVAFSPGLGFGITMQPGPVTREMLVGFFPHPTAIIHERLTGIQVMAVLEPSATNLKPAMDIDRVGGVIQTAGLRWTIDLTKPVCHRISGVYVGDRAIRDSTSYTVMTNGGLLQGTHRQATFAHGADIVRDERTFGAVLDERVRAMGTLRAPTTRFVTLIK